MMRANISAISACLKVGRGSRVLIFGDGKANASTIQRLDNRLIDRRAKLRHQPKISRHLLRHQNGDELFLRVNEKTGRSRACPVERAYGTDALIFRRVGDDLKAEAE